ncbi:alpha-L-fucosidase [Draconibacterium sediminis]|uniref:alpha-L-fucosidase n=1 Tax=Draconibacterium sediminis TaxID=1544798 RepID=A0A0D8J980_9BACT|nr:alpha-L-fucosidase [Draconibacterium sediminis]KJF43560.1 alpha-L-fucosidase [Draconibacterium sediminis]
MQKQLTILLVLMFFCLPLFAQGQGDEDANMMNAAKKRDQQAIDEAKGGWWTQSMRSHEERIEWWRDARFGMFVHWGVYSGPGGEWKGKKVSGYSEHLMRKEKIPLAKYKEEVVKPFNPVDFNADEWIRTARDAGMIYFVITAKHHDGFAMFDSDVSDYNVVDATKWGKDPMTDLAAACKKYGVKFGFYYSHAFDWEDPNAPGNDWDYNNPGGDLNLFGGRYWYDVHPELLPKAVKYVDEKAIPQIKELLTNYHPDIIWFDTPHKLPLSENIRILQAIREIDRNVVVNGRLARYAEGNMGDYQNTADRPAEFFPVTGDWEAIPTTNESYGYSKFDDSHKPASFFIRLLANAASRGGNLLMNIGPMGNGKIDSRDLKILRGIGQWMKVNGESIYGTQKSPLPLQSWGVCTQKGNRLYLHVFDWPANGKLVVGGLKTAPKKAWLLKDPSQKELQVKRMEAPELEINLPKIPANKENSVVVLEMGHQFETDSVRLLSAETNNRLLAFDAKLQGAGFRYGDGKKDRYYVDGWTKTEQSVSWDFRLDQPINACLKMRFLVDKNSGGKVRVLVAGNEFPLEIEPSDKTEIRSVAIGSCSIPVGRQLLTIKPEQVSGESLMKLFEVEINSEK